ncbi:hypothetical protein BLA29_000104 [Euroglyphus maynei]|uniref:Uncharacterized protein n=1 Tax=Euroglyphus maynei TaxID=6958 RepID=A0A1Y3B6W6_EURMA|nr:hypothetical protein BLA29_000104 [Euroglyphus maynei]
MDSVCLNGGGGTKGFDPLKGSRDNRSSLLSSWLFPSNTFSLVSQPLAIFHKFKNSLCINNSKINNEMENIELKYSTSCPADIAKPSQLSFLCYINHQENSQEPFHQDIAQFQNNSQIHTSFLMKNCNNINLSEKSSLMKTMTKMDLAAEYFHQFSMNEKIKCHRRMSSLRGFEMDKLEPMFPSLINSTLPFMERKRCLSSSSLDDIKHLPYDLHERAKNIVIEKFDEMIAEEKSLLETTKVNGFNENLITKTDNDINCQKTKKRNKNRKRRNRKKKNRDKCKSFSNVEEKLIDNQMKDEPKNRAVNTQSDLTSSSSSSITTNTTELLANEKSNSEKNCFISKFFSFPCHDDDDDEESKSEIFEPQSINWDDENETDDDVPINGSLEKEFTCNGLFFSNLVTKEPRKIHCEIEFSVQDFLIDSTTTDDFDDENIWVETPEEREFREKMQAMVTKANEEWDAISLPPECNDNDVGVFALEIKSPQLTQRRVQFVEDPIIWFISDLED